MQRDLLGSAGADVGADAVIAPDRDEPRLGTTVRRPVGGGTPLPPARAFEFEGQAIRFIPGTCS
jgi:hypothetical protein